MKPFIKSLIRSTRNALADMLGQILALLMFVIAGLAWLYFSTIYAVVPVIIVGVLVGGYMYGWVEGKDKTGKDKE